MVDFNHADKMCLGASAVAAAYVGADRVFPMFNEATGGTYSTVVIGGKRYALHVFTASATLTVARAISPFEYVLVGAGGGGASFSDPGNGASGAGGIVVQGSTPLAAAAYPVGIGAPGAGGDVPTGTAGGTSTALSLTAAGGTPGGWSVDGTGGSNLSLDFDGTGFQGYGMDAAHASYTVAGKYGGGGGGGSAPGLWGFPGMTGAFLIRYEIAM
jgi:hypothetical protein